jgi:hypothetical protein
MSSLKMDQARLGTVQEECAKYQTRVTQFSDGFADSVAASNMAHDHALNAGKGQQRLLLCACRAATDNCW